MFITACDEREKSPVRIRYTFNGFSFYHCCHMLSDTADYGLQMAACQVVILFGWVWEGLLQKKKLKFCS